MDIVSCAGGAVNEWDMFALPTDDRREEGSTLSDASRLDDCKGDVLLSAGKATVCERGEVLRSGTTAAAETVEGPSENPEDSPDE